MGQVLHGSATTTEAVRRAIQHSQECQIASKHDPHFARNRDPSGLEFERL